MTAYALQSAVDTSSEVDTKIANALLSLATEAFVAAQLASRDASITALQASKVDAALLASYATNAALSASETTLQSALDAILAELAALQLPGGGVVNAPAWAGFTTWELLRGSNVVRNLHFMAPLSAALANGDDTLSITADCYSTAGTDAAITAALLAYYTAAQVDALLGDYRTASAQDTQTQAAIAGALLAYRTGPGQDVFTTNQITSALVAYRSAADQDTATASSIAAALLSYYTIAQVDGLLAGKLGVTEAASALQIAVRFADDGGADEAVAAIGEQILGPTDVSLSNWTVRPSSGCSVVPRAPRERGRLHPDPGGEPLEHCAHLQLDPGPRAPLRLPLPARHGLQLRGVRVRGRQRLRPIVRQLRGRPGRLEHGQDVLHSAAKRSCGAHFQAPGLPGRNGGRLRPPDPGRNPGGRQHGGGGHGGLGPAAEARVPRRRGRRRHAGHPGRDAAGAHAHHAGRSNSRGFQLEGYAMTLSAFAWNIVRTYTLTPGRRYSFACRYRLGTASNFVMYVSAADNDYVGVTGTFLGTPAQGVWSSLDFSVPLGGIAKLHFEAFGGSIPGLVQQSAGTLDLYSMQIRATAFEGDFVSVTDLLADLLALTGSATLDGLPSSRSSGPLSGAALLLDTCSLLQPAQFFVRKRSSEKSEVLVTVSVLDAKSCGAETVPELVTSPHTTLPVDTPPLVAVKVQSRLSQSSGEVAGVGRVVDGECTARDSRGGAQQAHAGRAADALPDTAPVDVSVAPATAPVAVSAAQETAPEASTPVVNT